MVTRCMDVPERFAAQLRSEFNGRYRLRWSHKFQEWNLEQKVGLGEADPPFRIDAEDDSMIRAKDGYWFVMAIRPGTTMPCPILTGEGKDKRCGATVPVPVMETAEAVCIRCQLQGRDGRTAAAYWPLNDALIQHIRRIDAVLGHNEDLKRIHDEKNKNLMDTAQRDALNDIDDVSYDLRKTLGGIEQIGYGGSIIRPVGDL